MIRSIIVGVAALLAITTAGSTRAFGAAVQVSSFFGNTYVQDFNTLSTANAPGNDATSGPAWTNGTTLTGWHAWIGAAVTSPAIAEGAPTYYVNSNGTAGQQGRLLNLGLNGNSDRALGLQSRGTSGSLGNDQYIGVQLLNDTGNALTSFTATYDAEHWRMIGGNHPADQLLVQYQIFNGGDGSINAGSGWTTIPSMAFGPSATTAGASTALDGNLPANRVADLTATLDVNWQNGQELWIRWVDPASPWSAHQIGIDNVRISAVPEPSSVALLAFGMISLWLFRRKKV